jgi:ABC-type antimicrobial peptide transport system permease subunit
MMYASVWLPIEAAQALFAPRSTSQFLYVQVAPGVDAADVLEKLQNDPRLAGQYTVYFEENYTRRNTQIVKDLASLMRVVSLIALLAVSFGAYNATALSIVERRREAGILRAVGFEPRSVRAFLLVRALWIGLLAWAVGLGVAFGFASYQANTQPLFVYGLPMIYRMTSSNALIALGWVAALTPLGAWLASRQFLDESVHAVLRKPA